MMKRSRPLQSVLPNDLPEPSAKRAANFCPPAGGVAGVAAMDVTAGCSVGVEDCSAMIVDVDERRPHVHVAPQPECVIVGDTEQSSWYLD